MLSTRRRLIFASFFAFFPGLISCARADEFDAPREWARIQDKRISESSGLAASAHKDFVWTHVDGPRGHFYLIDSDGKTRADCDLKGVKPTDCEDMADFRIGEKAYLLIADTGDNDKNRTEYALWLIEEPTLAAMGVDPAKEPGETPQEAKKPTKNARIEIDLVGSLKFTYPEGPQNCEAIGVDVAGRMILLVTKEQAKVCTVYKLPLPFDAAGKFQPPAKGLVAERVGTLNLPTITGGALRPEGDRLILMGRRLLFEFIRHKLPDGTWEPWRKTLEREPVSLIKPKQEQGEAVGFARDGRSLLISSEGKHQPIWLLPAKKKE